jgi:hypothetical protein
MGSGWKRFLQKPKTYYEVPVDALEDVREITVEAHHAAAFDGFRVALIRPFATPMPSSCWTPLDCVFSFPVWTNAQELL